MHRAHSKPTLLLVVDELGYVPLSQTGAELLFEKSSRSAMNVAPH